MATIDLPKLQRSLRDSIGENEIALALSDLKKALPEGSKKAALVILLQGRQTKLNHEKSSNIISTGEFRLEYSRISHDLLELIDGLEPADFEQTETDETTNTTARVGHILYKIPSKMKVGIEKRCLVRLAFEKKTLLEDLDYNDDTHEDELRVEDEMEVYLFDPSADDDKAFEIRAENENPRQFLEKGFFTEWIFYAKPLREGTRTLKVRAVVLLVDGTREKRKEITFESEVLVTATEPQPEPAEASEFKTAGFQFQATSATNFVYETPASKPRGVLKPAPSAPPQPQPVYSAPAESRTKSPVGLTKMIAQSVGLVLFVGALAYYFTPRPTRDAFFAGLKKDPAAQQKLVEKYENDPSTAAQKVVENAIFKLAETSGQIQQHQVYLDKYPNGRHKTDVDNWIKKREIEAIEELKKMLASNAGEPVENEKTALIWIKLKRFATDFGPTEKMLEILPALKNRPDLQDEGVILLENTCCLWVKSHPRPGNKLRFLFIFPKSTCLNGWEDATNPLPGSNPKIGASSNSALPAGKPLPDFEIDLIFIEGGRMSLGNAVGPANETKTTVPIHEVEFDGFYLSKYEVTQAQWMAVMDANPSHKQSCETCPVENVSWDDVHLFLQKLNAATAKNYRLPTESEWEYAARGGQKSQNFTLSGSDDIELVAWFSENSGGNPHPVGQKSPNELGLFDMSGNAKEWCADPWHDNYKGAPGHAIVWENGGDASRHVTRGGSFNSPTPPLCRSTARDRQANSARTMTVGFRLARD